MVAVVSTAFIWFLLEVAEDRDSRHGHRPRAGGGGMINDDLAALLEGCHRRAEVRLAVALPGMAPVEMTIVGNAISRSLGLLPPGSELPGTVWLLSGSATGPLPPWW